MNSAALLLAREMATPSSPATHINFGVTCGIRTHNLLVHSQALSPVELTPPKQKRWSRERGLNSRSPLYKRGILPAELSRLFGADAENRTRVYSLPRSRPATERQRLKSTDTAAISDPLHPCAAVHAARCAGSWLAVQPRAACRPLPECGLPSSHCTRGNW